MSIRSRALIVLVLAVLPTACSWVKLPRLGSWTVIAGRPVALFMEGSALTPPARARTAQAVERTLGRPVHVVDALSTKDDDAKRLFAPLAADRSLARYEWREPQCAAERAVLLGITRGLDAVYRAVVDYSARERSATDAEWDELQGLRFGFRRLRERPTVREELLTGTVTRRSFVLEDATKQASLYRRRVMLASDTQRIDVAAAVAETVRGLGAVPTPEWDALAHRLLKQDCPFLAWAVADSQLARAAREPVQTAAITAMRASLGRRVARQRAGEAAEGVRAALRDGDVERAAALLADYEASPARKAATVRELGEAIAAARAPSEGSEAPPVAAVVVSCATLCEMHMIEICNSDKVLWSAHRARWEPTACGTRREETFLTQCYREQWETGTFETSCVQPCEASDAGRTRLMAILQEAGCVAGPAPS